MRSPTNLALKRRLEGSFVFLMVLFFALALRLVWIQGIRQKHFNKLAENYHNRTLRLPAERGLILDRRKREIASNVEAKTLFANPQIVPNKAEAASQIAAILGGSSDYYLKLLSKERHPSGKLCTFVYLKRLADRSKADRVLALKIPGIEAQAEPKRIYPSGSLAAHLLGFVDIDGIGREGIEKKFEPLLHGRDGKRLTEVDAIGRPIPDTDRYYQAPINGGTIQLTIDATIQEFAEAEMRKIMEQFAPEGACAIVIDVPTGEVLALANAPTYDPNHYHTAQPASRRNRAVQDWYEPGSTFKTLTIAEAVDRNLPSPTVMCTGSKTFGKRTIRCAHGARHGRVDLHKIEQVSCNVGVATIGLRLGAPKLYASIKRFGFLKKTGIELPNEVWGNLPGHPEEWRDITTANVAFGQSIAVTPIEMAQMYAAIANDGVLLPPTILMSINGKPHQPQGKPRRVLSPQTARTLHRYMQSVVVGKGGTGHNAKIADYTVAGKTGTAQMVRDGRYLKGAYVSSFIGYVPATRPRIAILVAATYPTKNGHYGGTVAAPAFREIARQSMRYLKVPPDAPGDYRDGSSPIVSFARWEREHGGAETPTGSGRRVARAASADDAASD